MRVYELYTDGPIITNRTAKYRTGMWVVQVKAQNIKQAYSLTARKIIAKDKLPGIVSVDNSNGPSFSGPFPWPEELWPKHWRKDERTTNQTPRS